MAFAPTQLLADRHGRLRRAFAERHLDALVVTHLANIFYLTNFAGSSAIAVLTERGLHFITDFRYVTAVEELWASPGACPGATLVRVDTTYDDTLQDLLKGLGARRVGFEAAHVPVAQHGRWAAALAGVELVPTERLIEAERARKDVHEVEMLRRAAELLTASFDRIVAEARPGRSERQVAAGIDFVMKDVGFDRAAFDTIVASGPNGALPHAHPGDRVLARGDLVVLDVGGVAEGYCVDLTRTVSLGEPDAEARRVYAAVAEAHAAGVAASRPGATARQVDRAARGTLERLGLGEVFGHGTGHGLGIEVHEEPWIRRTRPPGSEATAGEASEAAAEQEVIIESGMVFTIEPGAYLPGWGGVRLEDDILVTDSGPEFLTHVPRDLRIL